MSLQLCNERMGLGFPHNVVDFMNRFKTGLADNWMPTLRLLMRCTWTTVNSLLFVEVRLGIVHFAQF